MILVPVTEASLKRAMRDPRYWQAGHPERNDYVRWVTGGWDSLGAAAPGGRMSQGMVFVRAYERTRGGKSHHVSAHQRGTVSGRGGVQLAMSGADPVFGGSVLGQRPLLLGPPIGTRPALPRPPVRSIPARPGVRADTRRGSLGARGWYNTIPEQPGEGEAADAGKDAASTEPLLPSPPTVEELAAQTPRIPRRGRIKNPATEHTPQYDRGGGVTQRDADLQALRPGPGRPDPRRPEVISHPLPDGRTAVIRRATRRQEDITLEIQDHAAREAGRNPAVATHKFRYGVTP